MSSSHITGTNLSVKIKGGIAHSMGKILLLLDPSCLLGVYVSTVVEPLY